MALPKGRPEACHNCRRRRLRCDRSLPHCLKCIKTGQECLGYQRLFRWEQGVASRGKMAGLTFEGIAKDQVQHNGSDLQTPSSTSFTSRQSSCESTKASPLGSPTDPLVQDLDDVSRMYLFYFASDVCRDLVLYDNPQHNPFRELIPLTRHSPVLLQIIIANSALRMSNACQKSLMVDSMAFPAGRLANARSVPCLGPSTTRDMQPYVHALAAKHRALSLLKSALGSMALAEIDITLAVVLLFIEFELIDSGRDNWTYHIDGAKRLIKAVMASGISTQATMSPLRRCLISNCLVFDILGSALACPTDLAPDNELCSSGLSLLQDEEGNHCSSFPVVLLQLIQTGARLSHPDHSSSAESKRQEAALLLSAAQSFDPVAWATNLQPHSPATDLVHRTHIASAHRAAVCIYLSRVLLALSPHPDVSLDLETLVEDVIRQLSHIDPTNALFKAIPWPAFIAGAETNDHARQEWIAKRFQELWEVEPWGLIRGALGVLERIWLEKSEPAGSAGGTSTAGKKGSGNWVQDMRGRGVDWLII